MKKNKIIITIKNNLIASLQKMIHKRIKRIKTYLKLKNL